jgi:hypothetical protein
MVFRVAVLTLQEPPAARLAGGFFHLRLGGKGVSLATADQGHPLMSCSTTPLVALIDTRRGTGEVPCGGPQIDGASAHFLSV